MPTLRQTAAGANTGEQKASMTKDWTKFQNFCPDEIYGTDHRWSKGIRQSSQAA